MDIDLSAENISKLIEEIRAYDNHHLAEKASRLHKLYLLYPEHLTIAGKAETVMLFEEIKETFVNGQHLSTIILIQSFLEKALFNHIKNYNEKYKETSFYSMLRYVKENKLFPEDLVKMLDEIRIMRNPLVHLIKNPTSNTLLQRRLDRNKEDYFSLLEEVAAECLLTLFMLIKHNVFRYNLDFDFLESE